MLRLILIKIVEYISDKPLAGLGLTTAGATAGSVPTFALNFGQLNFDMQMIVLIFQCMAYGATVLVGLATIYTQWLKWKKYWREEKEHKNSNS